MADGSRPISSLSSALCCTSKGLNVGRTLWILIGDILGGYVDTLNMRKDSSRSVIKRFQIDDAAERSSLSRFAAKAQMHIQRASTLRGNYSQEEYIAGYHQYNCSIIKAESKIDHPSRATHGRIIAVVMLERFMSVYLYFFRNTRLDGVITTSHFATWTLKFCVL